MKSINLDQGYTSKEFLSKLLSNNYGLSQHYSKPNQYKKSDDLAYYCSKQKISSNNFSKNIIFHKVGSPVISPKNKQKQNLVISNKNLLTQLKRQVSQTFKIERNLQLKFKNQKKQYSHSTISSEVQLASRGEIQAEDAQIKIKQDVANNEQSVIIQKTILFLKKFLKGKFINESDIKVIDELQQKISNPFQFDSLLQNIKQPQKLQNQSIDKKQKQTTKINNNCIAQIRSKSQQKIGQKIVLKKVVSLQKRSQALSVSLKKIGKKQLRKKIKGQLSKIKQIIDKNNRKINPQAKKYQ